MLKPYFLRLHRWITLFFAIPLLFVIGTGLILSFQPIVQTVAIQPNSLTLAKYDEIVAKFDKDGKTRSLFVDPYENTLTLVGVGEDGSTDVNLTTLEESDEDSMLSELFSQSRRLHQRLIYSMGWLVQASTWAMLALAALGIAMGWQRIRNTVSGWHKATAWVTLPLLIISPLTGLALAYNITFQSTQSPAPAPPAPAAQTQASGQAPAATPTAPVNRAASRNAAPSVPVREVVAMVAAKHDLSNLSSIGNRGGRLLARVNDGGFLRSYVVTLQGLRESGSNWPRLIHEGNFAGIWSGLMNVVASIAMLGLLFTGLTIWARRTFRKRQPRARQAPQTGAATAGVR